MTVTPPPSEQVSAIMSTKVVTTEANKKVSEVLRAMVRHKVGSIIVVEKGKPIGILTERDITTRVAKGQNLRTTVVKRAMSRPLVTVDPSVEIWKAVEQMVRNDIRRLPVLDGGKLIGLVTEKDIMYWLVKVAYEPNIPEELNQLLQARIQAHALSH